MTSDAAPRAHDNPFVNYLDLQFDEEDVDHVICRMAVTDAIRNRTGVVHAGAFMAMADMMATILARQGVEIGPNGEGFPLAIDVHSTLLANQRDGEVRGESRIVRRGRRVTVVRTRLTGTEGRLLAEVTSTHIPA
ncbi:MAG: hotdog fold thioesterase [Dehalococcoidia bacterium]